MADVSRNAADNAHLERLVTALSEKVDRMEAQLVRGQKLLRDETVESRRSDRRAAGEASRARPGEPTAAETTKAREREVQPTERSSKAARDRADEDERSQRAVAQRRQDVEREVQAQRRAAGPTFTPGWSGGRGDWSGDRTWAGSQYAAGFGGPPRERERIPVGPATAAERSLRDVLPGAAAAPAAGAARAAEVEAEAAQKAAVAERIRAQELANATEKADATLARTRAMSGAVQYSTRVIGSNSDALRRHGALTSEFISAAARGQVEIRELGYQVGATIGKFAGWTAAATAVFGVVGALHQIGEGAQSANQGLAELERFTPNLNRDLATRQFVGTSRDLNLPVSEVVDTQTTFARIFPDQQDQSTATRTSLLATKLDAVSAADSYRYFTGIVQEFGLSASDLPTVLDQISAAQRRLGARVSETLPALARSSAAIKATAEDGANIDEIRHRLIAISATAQVASGQTGPVVGQALSRAASNFYRSAKSVPVERAFGLDPNEEFTTFMLHAIERASSLSGRQRQQLGRAIGGPAFGARIITQLLGQQPRVERALQVTSERASAGSTGEELRDKLKGVQEQLQQIPNELQRIGVELGRIGAFNVFGGALHALNAMLNTAEDVLRVFEILPDGPREVAIVLAQVALGLGLLRRLDVGRLFPKGSLAQNVLGRSDRGQLRTQIYTGLGDEHKFLGDERRRVALEGGRNARGLVRDRDALAGLRASGNTDTEKIIAAERRVTHAEEQQLALVEEERALAEQQRQVLADRNAFMRQTALRGGFQEPGRAAGALGIPYRRGDIAEPTTAPVAPIGGARDFARQAERQRGQITLFADAGEQAPLFHDEDLAAFPRQVQATEQEVGKFRQFVARGGISGRALSSSLGKASAGLEGLKTAAVRMGSGLKGFFASALAALGPLDALLIGIPVGLEFLNAAQEHRAAAQARINDIRQTATVPGLRAQVNKPIHEGFTDRLSSTEWEALHILNIGRGRDSSTNVAKAEQEAARERLKGLEQFNRSGLLLPVNVIRQNLQKGVSHARTQAQLRRTIARVTDEADASLAASAGFGDYHPGAEAKGALAKLRRQIQQARSALSGSAKDINAALDAVAQPEDIPEMQALLSNRLATQGPTRRNLRFSGQLAATYRVQARKHAGNPALASQYLQAADDAEQKGIAAAQAELQAQTYPGAPPGRASAARQAFVAKAREVYLTGPRKRVAAIRAQANATEKEILRLEALIALLPSTFNIGGLTVPNPRKADARAKLTGAERQLKSFQTAIDAITGNAKQRHDQLRAISAQTAQQEQQSQTELFDAQTQLQVSRTADPVAAARITANRLRERVGLLRRIGASAAEIDQAMAEYNNALTSLASSQAQRYQLQLQVNQSRANIGATQGQQLHNALGAAQQYAAYVRAHQGSLDPGEYLNAMNAVYQAQGALADYARQQAQAMSQARTAYAVARAGDDPIRKARAELAGAERGLRFAQTPAERLQGHADVISKRRDLRQTRQQQRFEDIEFERDIGKITRDIEIQQLQQLLKTIHGNQQLRRQIRRQIYQLRHEADQAVGDLDIGNIRLPTLYEIRRAVKGSQTSVHTEQTLNLQVNVKRAGDAGEVFDVIDRFHDGAGRSAARAARLTA